MLDCSIYCSNSIISPFGVLFNAKNKAAFVKSKELKAIFTF